MKGEAGLEPVEAGGAEWTRGGKRPGVEGHGRCVGLACPFLATPSLMRLVRHPHSPRNLHTSPGPMWLLGGHLPKDRLTAGARWVLVPSPLRWADVEGACVVMEAAVEGAAADGAWRGAEEAPGNVASRGNVPCSRCPQEG